MKPGHEGFILRMKSKPNSRPKWTKTYSISDQNGQNLYLISDQNGSKTIPFGTTQNGSKTILFGTTLTLFQPSWLQASSEKSLLHVIRSCLHHVEKAREICDAARRHSHVRRQRSQTVTVARLYFISCRVWQLLIWSLTCSVNLSGLAQL